MATRVFGNDHRGMDPLSIDPITMIEDQRILDMMTNSSLHPAASNPFERRVQDARNADNTGPLNYEDIRRTQRQIKSQTRSFQHQMSTGDGNEWVRKTLESDYPFEETFLRNIANRESLNPIEAVAACIKMAMEYSAKKDTRTNSINQELQILEKEKKDNELDEKHSSERELRFAADGARKANRRKQGTPGDQKANREQFLF